MRSVPTTRRTVLAAAFMAAGFVFTVAVKLTRGTDSALVANGLAGVLPNLTCAAFVPVVIFIGPRVITARDYLLFVVLILFGLLLYEVAQIWMPRRTFDFDDIWASAVGAVVAVALGFAFFLRPTRT